MEDQSESRFILASGSPRRKDLLAEAGYKFEIIPSSAEEIHTADIPLAELCEINAKIKARDIANQFPDATTLGADTLVYIDQTPLGKPKSKAEAFQTLQLLSGKTHQVCTGLAIIPPDDSTQTEITFHQITNVTFKTITDEQIEDYMEKVEVMDKAGSYAIQEHRDIIIESIDGDYENVVGLPQKLVTEYLERFNILPCSVKKRIPEGHRYPLLFNPHARSKRGRRALRFLMSNAKDFVLYATRDIDDARQLAKRFAANNEPVILAAGGDGTLNAVIQGLVGTNTALGVLPAGTMNVFARELGIPVPNLQSANLDKALEVVKKGYITNVDLFTVNNKPFVQMAGVGFDAQVIEETSLESKKLIGPLAYLMSAVKLLGDNPPKMTIRLKDGKEIEGVAVLAGNGELYGGQVRLFPKADNTDGLIDILIFKEKGYRLVMDSIKGLAGVLDIVNSTVEYLQADSFTVISDREVPIQVDGEYLGRSKEVKFAPTEHKLKVLAPQEPVGGFTKIWLDWVQKLPRKIAGDRG